MKFLNFIVPNYIFYVIGIIGVVSTVFLPILFTVILPKLQNNNANVITTNPNTQVLANKPIINLELQNTSANTNVITTTTYPVLLHNIFSSN